DVGAPRVGKVLGGRRALAVMELEAVDAHAEPAELHADVGAARQLDDVALPAGKDLVALAGVEAEPQWPAHVVENDGLLGEGTRESGQVGNLRMIEPGIEAQAEPAQRDETLAELGMVAIEVRAGLGVRIVDLGCLVLPGGGMADAFEARAGGG